MPRVTWEVVDAPSYLGGGRCPGLLGRWSLPRVTWEVVAAPGYLRGGRCPDLVEIVGFRCGLFCGGVAVFSQEYRR